MNAPLIISPAEHFSILNARRRAVRKFADTPVSDSTLLAIMREAQLAPSSHNSQPYRFICVRSPVLKAVIAPLCNDQAAARTAAALVVATAGPLIALETLDAWNEHLSEACGLDAASIAHHRKAMKRSRLFLKIGGWPVWSVLAAVLSALHPGAGLLPLGASGLRHWAARNACYAAQTFLLAATAYGLDTCPMEGFDAAKLGKALGLPAGTVMPLVIAVGYGAEDARLEPRWRKPIEHAMTLV